MMTVMTMMMIMMMTMIMIMIIMMMSAFFGILHSHATLSKEFSSTPTSRKFENFALHKAISCLRHVISAFKALPILRIEKEEW